MIVKHPSKSKHFFFGISSGEQRQVAASLPRKRLPFGSKPLRRRWELWALSGSGMLVVNNHRLLHHFIAKIYIYIVSGEWFVVNTKNLNKIEQVTSLRQCFVIFLLLAVRDSEIRTTPCPFWVGRLRRFRQVPHAFWGVLAESSLLFSFFHLNSWTRRFCWCLHRWWLGGKRRQQLFSTAERAAGTWDVVW